MAEKGPMELLGEVRILTITYILCCADFGFTKTCQNISRIYSDHLVDNVDTKDHPKP
jgi:hypothetical protein